MDHRQIIWNLGYFTWFWKRKRKWTV